ncbi:MAG: fasciclin domain-containing protein [Oscillatoriales cyanobacterium RM2_1_1]|nr:fasciclin domain-containing protein [Oscillatoriales cyanobacterium SM2_3_0]NJO47800.1 fasciclin domain-containing protein [Oscillatoriales cyanobacterium RM2_1_1]
MKYPIKSLLVLLAALGSVAVLAACTQPTAENQTDNTTEQTAEVPVTEAPATGEVATQETQTTTSPVTDEQAQTIVEIASNDSTFSTLVTALKAADLVEVLSQPGPYTVFAPTDEAFAALPDGTVEKLLEPENKDQLVKLLQYHVVPTKVMAADIQPGAVETVEGMPLEIQVDEGTKAVTVNGAGVVKTDITASNGVIHVIDSVLIPSE